MRVPITEKVRQQTENDSKQQNKITIIVITQKPTYKHYEEEKPSHQKPGFSNIY